MRKSFVKWLFAAVLLAVTHASFAVKAIQDTLYVKQPDGMQIAIRLHGNEFFHYQTTDDGYLVKKDSKGYFRYATVDGTGLMKLSKYAVKAGALRTASERSYLKSINRTIQLSRLQKSTASMVVSAASAGPMKVASSATSATSFPLTGSPKSLVILVNFSDKAFSVASPQVAFTNLLNQTGYSTNGGTGSAVDYFKSCSLGKFSPQFDVVGPYTLPNNMAYYGTNSSGFDQNPQQMVIDACTLAYNAGLDFRNYDTDGDGFVDNVFVYYAGYNEAEGAPSTTIWPHRWSLANTSTRFNGRIIFDYACTSELKGTSGANMCGIGTFCHEFGHVLGLPDYYHTTESKATLGWWSIMDYGSYANSGRTPPVYSCYDRFFLGWLTPQQVSSASNLALAPIYQATTQPSSTAHQSYLLSATTHNLSGSSPNPTEFYMLEYRKLTGWDAYLPAEGMLIWHIDYNQTAWDNNTPNNYTDALQTASSHMRVYLQPLSGSTTTPGTAFTSGSFTPTTWAGVDINRAITSITKTTDSISFKLMGGVAATLPVISSTTNASSITATSATSGGVVGSDGGATVTARGVCWSTSSAPTVSGTKTVDGNGTGAFSSSITGLTGNTVYYARAYATNSVGTSYGPEVSFMYTTANKNISEIALPAICDVVVSSGTTFTSNSAGQTLHSLTVNAGGSVSFSNAVTISSDVVLKSNNSSSFSATVGSGATVSGTVKYVKSMDNAHWYFLSFPCDVLISDIKKSDGTSLGVLGTDWFIQYYNGSTRVTNQGSSSNWVNITNTAQSLTAYQGYAIGLKDGVGPFDVAFPLTASLLSGETLRKIPVTAYGSGNTGVSENNKGWNLVGQPYLSKFNSSNAGVRYLTFPNDATARTYTTQINASGRSIDPFSAFFVQANDSLQTAKITFALAGRQSVPSVAASELSNIQLTISTALGTDDTNLILDDAASASYLINEDAEKWLGIGTDIPQIFTTSDNINYAYNALPASQLNHLSLGYYRNTAGQTTISATKTATAGLSQLLLTDNDLNATTDLLAGSYSFRASAGVNTSRFTLSAQRIATSTTDQEGVVAPRLIVVDNAYVLQNAVPGSVVSIFNQLGQKTKTYLVESTAQKIDLDGAGVRFVVLSNEHHTWKYKVIVNK